MIKPILGELPTVGSLTRPGTPVATRDAVNVDFGELVHGALRRVSDTQLAAKGTAEAFSKETPGVELHDVMISLQDASLKFQQLVQVRNKLVTAYQEIMNMQV